jgi:hypothetical protein
MIRDPACFEWLGRPPASPAQRVVSLVPSLTDAVCRLGAGATLVGRTEYCVHPAEQLTSVPTVGGTKSTDIDQILAARPDVVLACREENVRRQALELTETVPVWLADPTGPQDAPELWAGLGAVLDREEAAARRAAEVRTALDETSWPHEPVRCRYYIWKNPWMAAGPDTYISRLLGHVGLASHAPAGKRRYPTCGEDPLADSCLHLLSTEPYEFNVPSDLAPHGAERVTPAVWQLEHGPHAVLVDGRRISWYPSCTAEGLRYAAALAAAARGTGPWPEP